MTDFMRVPCNLCGQDKVSLVFKTRDFIYKTTDETFDIVRCDNCALVYINPRPTDMRRYYPAGYAPHDLNVSVHIKKSLKKTLEACYGFPSSDGGKGKNVFTRIRHAVMSLEVKMKNKYFFFRIPYRDGRKVLDIGCGGGQYLLALKKLGWPVSGLYGIDYPNKNLKKNREEEKLNITEGNFMTTPMPENFFDAITLRHVFEHFDDPFSALKKIHTILRPGGELLINVPNFKSLERIMFKEECVLLDPPRHLYDFTPATLSKLMTRAGFDVVEVGLKKSPALFVWNIQQRGGKVSKFVEKYFISNMLSVFQLLGYSGEILCRGVKRQ